MVPISEMNCIICNGSATTQKGQCTCIQATQGTAAGGLFKLRIWGQPGQQSEILSQKEGLDFVEVLHGNL
jgi:hypothetical protein